MIGNHGLDVMNVPEVAKICKKKNVPFAIDATFNTPYLMKPISHGANIKKFRDFKLKIII